jgi:hypothetical protein
MLMTGSQTLESRVPFLGPAFHDAGLTDDEIRTLLQLCQGTVALPSYAFLKAENRRLGLASAYGDQLDIHQLGYSSDYPAGDPNARRIEAVIVHADRHKRLDFVASNEAPQHASELIGVGTAHRLKHLYLRHPSIMRRMGYTAVAISDHADPDAMELQQWARIYPATIKDFILGGVRGDMHSQLSWGYPTETFAGNSEAHASLVMHRQFQPLYIGSLHNSLSDAFQVVTPNFPILPGNVTDPLVRMLERLGIPVAYEWADPAVHPISPGLYKIIDTEELRGANILGHVPPHAVMHAPEMAMLQHPRIDTEPSGKTAAEAIMGRYRSVLPRLGSIATGLEALNLTDEQLAGNPGMRRLYDAALYWMSVGDKLMANGARIINFLPPEVAQRQLTKTEVLQTAAALISNSLMALGNVRRLALMCGKFDLASKLEHKITNEISRDLGPVQIAPLDLVICAQSLSVLMGMRRVAAASGLC